MEEIAPFLTTWANMTCSKTHIHWFISLSVMASRHETCPQPALNYIHPIESQIMHERRKRGTGVREEKKNIQGGQIIFNLPLRSLSEKWTSVKRGRAICGVRSPFFFFMIIIPFPSDQLVAFNPVEKENEKKKAVSRKTCIRCVRNLERTFKKVRCGNNKRLPWLLPPTPVARDTDCVLSLLRRPSCVYWLARFCQPSMLIGG